MASESVIGYKQLVALEKRAREDGVSALEISLRNESAGATDGDRPATTPKPPSVASPSTRSREAPSAPPAPSRDVLLAVADAPPKKSGNVAAVLWIFLNGLGGPWWYMGKPFSAIAAVIAYAFCAFLLVFAGIPIILILWIVDLICLSSSFRQYKRNREEYLRRAMG